MIGSIFRSDLRIQLIRLGVAVGIVTLVGTLGFVILEGWGALDAFYMTIITLSTVGFGEVHPLTTAGKVFTTALIMTGVVIVAFTASAVAQNILSGELTGRLQRKRMQKDIDALHGHYVICGFGRVGSQVAQELTARGKTCVIIESAAEQLERIAADNAYHFVHGDAIDDDVLERAGITRATGLVVATGDDATNLFVTLSARTLNAKLTIVARTNHPSSNGKLRQAGANHVISPYTISGQRIAAQLLTPSITDFLDVVMHSGDLELWLEECPVTAGSQLHSQRVAGADLQNRSGANVLAVRKSGGKLDTDLSSASLIEAGDTLIALGTRTQLQALHRIAAR